MTKFDAVSDPFDPRYQHTCFYLTDSIPEEWLQFAIITAHNPAGQQCDERTNRSAHLRLWDILNHRRIAGVEIIGSAPDDTHQERGVGLRCTLVEARELARAFNQLAFYWVDAGVVQLIETIGDKRVELGQWVRRIRVGTDGAKS